MAAAQLKDCHFEKNVFWFYGWMVADASWSWTASRTSSSRSSAWSVTWFRSFSRRPQLSWRIAILKKMSFGVAFSSTSLCAAATNRGNRANRTKNLRNLANRTKNRRNLANLTKNLRNLANRTKNRRNLANRTNNRRNLANRTNNRRNRAVEQIEHRFGAMKSFSQVQLPETAVC